MAYNDLNMMRRVNVTMCIYSEKEQHIPDTFFVENILPKHNIFISYRTFMTYKGIKKSRYTELIKKRPAKRIIPKPHANICT